MSHSIVLINGEGFKQVTGPSLSLRLHHGTVLNAVTTPTQIPVSAPIYFSAIVSFLRAF